VRRLHVAYPGDQQREIIGLGWIGEVTAPNMGFCGVGNSMPSDHFDS
jgi:hypothetical protein